MEGNRLVENIVYLLKAWVENNNKVKEEEIDIGATENELKRN